MTRAILLASALMVLSSPAHPQDGCESGNYYEGVSCSQDIRQYRVIPDPGRVQSPDYLRTGSIRQPASNEPELYGRDKQ